MRTFAVICFLFLAPLVCFGGNSILPSGFGELTPQEIAQIKTEIPDMKARAKIVLKGLAEDLADALAELRNQEASSSAPMDTYREVANPLGALRESPRLRAQRAYLTALLLQHELTTDNKILKSITNDKVKLIAKGGAPLLLAATYTAYLIARYGLMPWYLPLADLPDYVDIYRQGWIANLSLTAGMLHGFNYLLSWHYRSMIATLTVKIFARKDSVASFFNPLKKALEKKKIRIVAVTQDEQHLRLALEDELGIETGCIGALTKQ